MKFIPFLTVLCLFFVGITHAQTNEGTMEQFTLTHDDRERDYLVYTPADYDASKSYTLLLALHPATTTGRDMAEMTQFDSFADADNVIIVYPSAIAGRWNSSGTSEVDDIGFITALLDKISDDYAIDDTSVFVLGYSNGGLMTMKLRCVLSDRIAGIISYAAPMTFAISSDCLSAESVSSLVIHGTADEVFPYAGQATITDGKISGTFSADQTIGFLAGLNGCRTKSDGADISGKGTQYRVFSAQYNCDNTINELITIAGLGHYGWAGTLPVTLNGRDATLNNLIFRFIKQVKDLP